MNPIYFETFFEPLDQELEWPTAFAIISAYATTGQTWSDRENHLADQRLAAKLAALGKNPIRIIGKSPNTGHAEPSWASDLSFDDACNLGAEFKQDAIYYVQGDQLTVSYCDNRRARVLVGTFVVD